MTVSLHDVAQAAGVSRSTASRALTGSPLVSERTRARVLDAARRLNYRVNRTASALRSKHSHLIGLILNNLINATFHTVADVVQRRASERGYQVILCITDGDPEREAKFISLLADHNVDGMVVVGSGQNADLSNTVREAGTAVVNLIRSVPGSSAPTVLANDFNGAREATRHLLSLGHRLIGYIGGPEGTTSGHERFGGYRAALAEYGVDVSEGLVERGPFEPVFGTRAVSALIDRNPDLTALLAANHEAVFGILPALASLQVRIPDQISLICYEDIEWLKLWQPPITVVDNDARGLADLAMELLLGELTDPRHRIDVSDVSDVSPDRDRVFRIDARLVRRASTRAVKLVDGASER